MLTGAAVDPDRNETQHHFSLRILLPILPILFILSVSSRRIVCHKSTPRAGAGPAWRRWINAHAYSPLDPYAVMDPKRNPTFFSPSESFFPSCQSCPSCRFLLVGLLAINPRRVQVRVQLGADGSTPTHIPRWTLTPLWIRPETQHSFPPRNLSSHPANPVHPVGFFSSDCLP
ncbi:hypothetical protein LARV_03867 [Longilinea arvoryzae]|uniref:Uncharacterized protein n=1 Tax=Longilinea arvoryzae TaxID=360412 RepID=A0A0K8MYF5_9CHLR|nr:hypothetical protein LARV_03867 [Longilinea arvoryzae]